MNTNKQETQSPSYMVAVVSFDGMERMYFNSLSSAMTEYNRLMAHGRSPYFYNLKGI